MPATAATNVTMTEFDAAVRLFRARPDADALTVLNALAGAMMPASSAMMPASSATMPAATLPVVAGETNRGTREAETPWFVVTDSPTVYADLPAEFEALRATFDRELTAEELSRASGCIGYALRIYMAGEELSDPVVVSAPGTPTVATYFYDSTKSRRSEPDVIEALRVSVGYMEAGTPIRKTNRAGRGSVGTQLVAGIGKVGVAFALR